MENPSPVAVVRHRLELQKAQDHLIRQALIGGIQDGKLDFCIAPAHIGRDHFRNFRGFGLIGRNATTNVYDVGLQGTIGIRQIERPLLLWNGDEADGLSLVDTFLVSEVQLRLYLAVYELLDARIDRVPARAA